MEATQTYEYANWVLGGLAVFMVAMLGIGYYASTKIKDTEDYMAAGHRLGVWLTTGTLFATWFGAATVMGAAGNSYLFGNQGVIFDPWGAALCLIIAGLFFARLIRRGRFLTVTDMLENRYDRHFGLLASICLYLADLGWLAGMLVGLGSILNQFAGVDMNTGIIIACVIVVIYTYMGGMWAVTLTDFWQMLILIAGIIILFISMWPHGGGFDALFNNDPAGNWCGINQWSFVPTPESAANAELGNAGFFYYTGIPGWAYWISAVFSIGIGVLPTQSLLQRFLAAKNELTAVRAGWLGSFMYLTIGMLPVLIGMIYFKVNPDLSIDEAMTKLVLYAAIDYLHPVFTVIFIIALTAAVMSSADSILLAVSSLVGKNVYRYFKPEVTDGEILKLTRRLIPVNALVALAIGLSSQAIFNLAIASGVVAFVSICMPFICAFFFKKANSLGVISGVLGGFVSWIIGYFYFLPMTTEANTGILEEGVVYTEWAFWDAIYISAGIAPIICLALIIVVSLATQKINPAKPMVDVDGNLLPLGEFFGNPLKQSSYELSEEAAKQKASV